ncbi:hypothetical protein Bcop_0369 [Bacteroides coprosuis DSM 18011]|uniref:DUF4271 domain-containing protein n=1 Tax=Bacteroides coprosuis DSM 18011 TaxID=679937 RepID=F3ZQS9_9BACE|nr:hypothetical protein Bcop_0369 [Bacteroides coprosuis DSM 18011]
MTIELTKLATYIGNPMTYLPAYDNTITIILLSCFFITCFSLAKSKSFLLELGRNFVNSKTHVSAFSTSTNTEINSLIFLILQTCVMVGITLYILLSTKYPQTVEHYQSGSIIGLITGVSLFYLLIKWMVYSFIGWVFNDRVRTSIWIESYSTIIYYLGLILYPIVLFIIYYNTSNYTIVYVGIGLFVLTKCLIYYKWIKLFSKKIYGHILLFLYFCALEIIPCVILYKCMHKYIDVLTINI